MRPMLCPGVNEKVQAPKARVICDARINDILTDCHRRVEFDLRAREPSGTADPAAVRKVKLNVADLESDNKR
jgi:hypothetical protein